MNWQKQLSLTFRLDGHIQATQWMIGFNVTDDRPADNIFGFLLVNVFIGPIRFGAMWEPQRQKQLDWQAAMARKEAEFERELEKLKQKNNEAI